MAPERVCKRPYSGRAGKARGSGNEAPRQLTKQNSARGARTRWGGSGRGGAGMYPNPTVPVRPSIPRSWVGAMPSFATSCLRVATSISAPLLSAIVVDVESPTTGKVVKLTAPARPRAIQSATVAAAETATVDLV